MQCPIDATELMMTERGGVEIDYCPKCRGVWLDRGELDKIIERAGTEAPRMAPESDRPTELRQPAPPRPAEGYREERPYREEPRYRDDDDDDDRYRRGKPYRKRRESFLSDLFDF